MKKAFMVLAGLLVAALVGTFAAQAATVHLSSGVAVSGKIVETNSDSIKVDIEGVTVTYYKDEIASIEGDEAVAKTLGVASIGADVPAQPVADAEPEPLPAEPAADLPAPGPEAVAGTAPVAVAAPDPVKPAAPAAEPSAALSLDKKAKILKFIEVFGTRDTMKVNFDQIMASMPPEDAQKLKEAFNIDAVIQELVPLYDNHFTEEDLDGFIQFYTSPVGKKLVQKIPVIMTESVEASARYFEEHMPQDMQEETAPAQK